MVELENATGVNDGKSGIEFSAHLDILAGSLREIAAAQKRLVRAIVPVRSSMTASGVVDGLGNLLMEFPQPAVGYVWFVRRLVASLTTWGPVSGGAQFYDGLYGTPQGLWYDNNLPYITTWSGRQIAVFPRSNPTLYVTAGSAGNVVQATIEVEVLRADQAT